MPTHAGPNTAAESSIIFSYDVGDVTNSYRGEPTTNLINPNTVNIYSWWTRNVASIVQLSETYKGQPIYRVSISIDDGDMLYHIRERWGAGSGWYMPYVTFNANTAYIASVIYRPVSHPDTRIYGHPSNISGWGLNIDGNVDIDSQWKLHRIDRNFASTVGDNRFYHMHTPSAAIGQTIIVDITHSQIEQNNHVTPFVNGTRSATQGLVPLIGNSTINLSNVSFNSAAQMTFDGSDDYINLATNLQSGFTQASYEFICRPTSLPGTGNYFQLYIQENSTWIGLYNVGAGAFFGIDLGNGSGWFDGNGGWTTGARTTATLTANKYYHVVYSWNGTTVSIYLNGVLQSTTSTLQAANGRQNVTTLGSGGTPRNIGARGSGNFWPGNMDIIKFYNNALTSDQVKQNYQQYKSRFNLS